MNDDERCCGTGTCIINAEGFCWCGQKWDGQKMCFPDRETAIRPSTGLADGSEYGKTPGPHRPRLS